MEVRSNRKIGGKPLEVSFPARSSACAVAGGAMTLEAACAIAGIGRFDGGRRWIPVFLRKPMLRHTASMQTFQIAHQVVAALIAKEKSIGRHDGGSADLGRVIEVELEPQS